jgi:hypothetical protein
MGFIALSLIELKKALTICMGFMFYLDLEDLLKLFLFEPSVLGLFPLFEFLELEFLEELLFLELPLPFLLLGSDGILLGSNPSIISDGSRMPINF